MLEVKFKNDTLSSLFINGNYNLHLGLSTTGGEVSADDYSRVPVTFGEPSDGLVANDTEVRFPVALSDWGAVTSIGLYDGDTAGELLMSQTIAEKNVGENEQIYVPVGAYSVEVVECD